MCQSPSVVLSSLERGSEMGLLDAYNCPVFFYPRWDSKSGDIVPVKVPQTGLTGISPRFPVSLEPSIISGEIDIAALSCYFSTVVCIIEAT